MSQLDRRLEGVINAVSRPGRYIGGDWHRAAQPLNPEVRFLLAFPDAFEVGMSNLGLQILYYIAANMPGIFVDRCFAPWPDLEGKLREIGQPLRSLDHHIPLNDFDVIGFSLQHELSYTNVLTMLALAGIPFLSSERDETQPLILGGGPCASNPEPIAPVFDAFLLGDGEDALPEILEVLRQHKRQQRSVALRALAAIDGVYVPQFFAPQYGNGACLNELTVSPEQPTPFINRRILMDLENSPYPVRPLVPISRVIHDRITVEIGRGCKHQCRFCPSSTTSKPLRFRSPEKVLELAKSALQATGHSEISLAAFNIVDYPFLNQIVGELVRWGEDRSVAVSIPSIRPGGISTELAQLIQSSRKTGFTIAPEAGTTRLRSLINKHITEEDVHTSASHAFAMGWKLLKLYFMAGLPSETDADLQGMYDLCQTTLAVGRRQKVAPLHLNVSVSLFVPKPHTPFQWVGQASYLQLREKRKQLDRLFRDKRISLKPADPAMSLLEAVFARGDRRVWPVLAAAWHLGCRFDNWAETFDFQRWQQAFASVGIAPEDYAEASYSTSQRLAWDHLHAPFRKDYLREDYERFLSQLETPPLPIPQPAALHPVELQPTTRSKLPPKSVNSDPVAAFRFAYERSGRVRFLSHLDIIRVFALSLRQAGIPVAYSQGFNPHPRISFGPALPVGFESTGEYADVRLTSAMPPDEFRNLLNARLPEGLNVTKVTSIPTKGPSIDSAIVSVGYTVLIPTSEFPELFDRHPQDYADALLHAWQAGESTRANITRFNTTVVPDVGLRFTLLSRPVNGKILRPDQWAAQVLSLEHRQLVQLRVTRQGLFADDEGRAGLV